MDRDVFDGNGIAVDLGVGDEFGLGLVKGSLGLVSLGLCVSECLTSLSCCILGSL